MRKLYTKDGNDLTLFPGEKWNHRNMGRIIFRLHSNMVPHFSLQIGDWILSRKQDGGKLCPSVTPCAHLPSWKMSRVSELDTASKHSVHLQKSSFALKASSDVIKSQLVLAEGIRNMLEGCTLIRKFLWKGEILKHLLWWSLIRLESQAFQPRRLLFFNSQKSWLLFFTLIWRFNVLPFSFMV